jgi:hydrogenase maturation protein HypF
MLQGVWASNSVSPVTTSVGRLFDAVAALCGLRPRVSYEGQAAVELEWAASRSGDRGLYQLGLERLGEDEPDSAIVLDPRGAIRAVNAELSAGVPAETVAARFHRAVAAATAGACAAIASDRGLDTVVLSGGVFQNRLLLGAVTADLEHRGLRVLTPRLLPANDGGISFGQAAVAAMLSGAPADQARH